jgi:hypothetical protein
MALSAADVFSTATLRLRIVAPIVFFWNAPRRPRSEETWSMAAAMTFWASVVLPVTMLLALPLVSDAR